MTKHKIAPIGSKLSTDIELPETADEALEQCDPVIVLRYIWTGWKADAERELHKLDHGGRGGKHRPADAEIVKWMGGWRPGRDFFGEKKEEEAKDKKEATRRRLEQALAKLDEGE